jgi:hypothetical protein
MEKMLVAGCWILVFKGNYPFLIQHQASPPASPALGHELGPNGAARDGGQAVSSICLL